MITWVEDIHLVSEINDRDEELVVNLDDDEVMERVNSQLEPSRIENIVRDDKMTRSYLI